MRRDTQILHISRDSELINLSGGRIDCDLHRGQPGVHIPELHRVIITGSDEQDLVLGLLSGARGILLRLSSSAALRASGSSTGILSPRVHGDIRYLFSIYVFI